jgi:putative ABC transport system permease protein
MVSTLYTVQNLRLRFGTSALTAAGIALVVLVFAVVMGLANGLTQLFVRTGSPDNLLLLRRGASAPAVSSLGEDVLERVKYLPVVKTTARGVPLVSGEVLQSLTVASAGSSEMLVDVRGVDPIALEVHEGVRISSGRMPAPASAEVLVGRGTARGLGGTAPGATLRIGGSDWTVVGVLDSGGSVYESEIWCDRRSLMQAVRRENLNFIVMKVDVAGLEDAVAIGRSLQADQSLSLRVIDEANYYAFLAQSSGEIRAACLVLVLITAIGMAFTAMNTMYASTASRRGEIGVLRTLGFSRAAILTSFVSEAGLVAAIGGLAGGVLALTVNGTAFAYEGRHVSFAISPTIVAAGILLAAVIGLAGGLLPAYRASRLEVIDALRTE